MIKKMTVTKSVTPILLIALTVFILTAAAGFFISSNTVFTSQNEKNALTNWRFVWSNTPEVLEKNISVWKYATKEVKINKQFGQSYIRLNYTLPVLEEDHVLNLIMANNPIKVKLNGKEIYNNHYDTDDFTGNKLNRIDIPSSNLEQTLDIFAKVPFAFSIKANLIDKNQAESPQSLVKFLGLVFGVSIILIGMILILIAVMLSIHNKNLGNLVILGAITMLTGAALVLLQLGMHLDTLTLPIMYKLQIILSMLIFGVISFVTLRCMGEWSIPSGIITAFVFIYTLMFALISNNKINHLMILVYPILLLTALMIIVLRLCDFILTHQKYGKIIFFSYLFGSFHLLFDSVNLILGFNNLFSEMKYIGILTYIVITFSVLIKQAIFVNIRLDEREAQVKKDTVWISRVISACAGVFVQQEQKNFFIQAAKSVRELIYSDDADGQEENSTLETNQNISISVAMKVNGRFTEMFNEGSVINCDYNIIERFALQKNTAPMIFGSNYMDIMFYGNGQVLAILHFEGIDKGLSDNLKNIINIAYTNICVAFDNLELKKDIVQTQENVFLDIAEIAEKKSENTGKHLKIVSEMVRLMCQELRLSEHETNIVSVASMVHDIGKLAIPEGIIGKKGKLSEHEYKIVKEHTTFGYNMLSRSPGEFMAAGAVIAQQHHEKYDGTGYLGLKGEQIHLYARITALIDVFDALLSKRPYKEAWSFERVCDYINGQSGKHFDPRIVAVFNGCKGKLFEIQKQINLEKEG